MQDIIENVTIIYKNGYKELCDAISISEKGVYTGQIKKTNKNGEEFINHSYIPKDQIQKIMFFNIDHKLKVIDFKKYYREENEKWKEK